MLSIDLLFAGHDRAGGGFSGGLVAGQAFVLRYLAGGRMDDSAIVSMRPPVLIGLGLTIASGSAFLPLLFGGQILETAIYKFTVPPLGEIKFVSSVLLDSGVYLLIVGVVLFVMVRRTWVRVVGVLYPLSTFFVVMGSGNHFLLDVVAGVGLIVVVGGAVLLTARQRRPQGDRRLPA